MKSAVYLGTRNIYADTIPSIKSLLAHSDVDKVYFITEDDGIGEYLPPCVEIINMSGQAFFPRGGPNYTRPWTWMALMKAALPKILTDDRTLVLDYDVFIEHDISELWGTDMTGAYFAGVTEWKKVGFPQPYINFGVLLLNLAQLRDGMDDRIIHALNTEYSFTGEQDLMNRMCHGHIVTVPSTYNMNAYVEPCDNPKVVHYAGIGEYFPWSRQRWQDLPLAVKYRAMSWEDALRGRKA